MDADAYLKRLGWRGTGHSLDHSDRGIKKPLLIAHKQDQLGLGTKKAAHKTDDQWWMRAFDQSLQNIGTGKESTLTQIRKSGINRGGLYGFFVRGEGLEGTLSPGKESSSTEASTSNSSTAPTKESTPATSASDASDDEMSADSTISVQKASAASRSKKRKRAAQDTADMKRVKQDAGSSAMQVLDDVEITRAASVLKRIERQSKSQAAKEAKTWPSKQAKYDKGKSIRKATMQIKKQMIADALVSGQLPNPRQLGPDQADQYLIDMEGLRKKAGEQRKADRKVRNEAADKAAGDDHERVCFHIATLKPKKKAEYEERAARKGRTLEQYILHRLQKEDAKQEETTSLAPPLFFADASGDKKLVAQAPQLAREKEERLAEREARLARRRKARKLKDERIDALAKEMLIKERGALDASTAKAHVIKKAKKKARKEIKLIDKFGEAAAVRKKERKAEKRRLAKQEKK